MIEIKAAIEACNDGIIDDIIWIRRKFNLAGVMKKPPILAKLVQVSDESKLHYEMEQSIIWTTTPVEQENEKAECENKYSSTAK